MAGSNAKTKLYVDVVPTKESLDHVGYIYDTASKRWKKNPIPLPITFDEGTAITDLQNKLGNTTFDINITPTALSMSKLWSSMRSGFRDAFKNGITDALTQLGIGDPSSMFKTAAEEAVNKALPTPQPAQQTQPSADTQTVNVNPPKELTDILSSVTSIDKNVKEILKDLQGMFKNKSSNKDFDSVAYQKKLDMDDASYKKRRDMDYDLFVKKQQFMADMSALSGDDKATHKKYYGFGDAFKDAFVKIGHVIKGKILERRGYSKGDYESTISEKEKDISIKDSFKKAVSNSPLLKQLRHHIFGVLIGALMSVIHSAIGLFKQLYRSVFKFLFTPGKVLLKSLSSLLKKAISQSQIIHAISQMIVVPLIIMFEYLLIPAIKVIAPMVTQLVKLIVNNKDKILAWGDKIAEIVSLIIEPFSDAMSNDTFWENPIAGLFDAMTSVLNNIVGYIQNNYSWISDKLKEVFISVFSYIGASAELAGEIVNMFADALSSAMSNGNFDKLVKAITDNIDVVFMAIEKVLWSTNVINVLIRFFSEFIGIFMDVAKASLFGGSYESMVQGAYTNLYGAMNLRDSGLENIYYDSTDKRVHGNGVTLSSLDSSILFGEGVFSQQSSTNQNIYLVGSEFMGSNYGESMNKLQQYMENNINSVGSIA